MRERADVTWRRMMVCVGVICGIVRNEGKKTTSNIPMGRAAERII
jgi:hypothetical protein